MTRRDAKRERSTRRGAPLLAALGAILCAALPAAPALAAQPSTVAAFDDGPAPEQVFAARLGALRPSEPQAYFELAEEVADLPATPRSVALAQRLYVLALELDLRRGAPTAPLGAGACLGLAALTRVEGDQRWLRGLAGLLDPRYAALVREPVEAVPEASDAYRLATFLGMVRSGDGVGARRLLDDPRVRELLERYDRLISPFGVPGGAAVLVREAGAWPCPECRSTRVVRRPGNPPTYQICPTCRGTPGLQLSPQALAAQVNFEVRLLRGIQRSWAAAFGADGGALLREPDAREVARVYRVDPAKVYFRDGRWLADPEASLTEGEAQEAAGPPPPGGDPVTPPDPAGVVPGAPAREAPRDPPGGAPAGQTPR